MWPCCCALRLCNWGVTALLWLLKAVRAPVVPMRLLMTLPARGCAATAALLAVLLQLVLAVLLGYQVIAPMPVQESNNALAFCQLFLEFVAACCIAIVAALVRMRPCLTASHTRR